MDPAAPLLRPSFVTQVAGGRGVLPYHSPHILPRSLCRLRPAGGAHCRCRLHPGGAPRAGRAGRQLGAAALRAAPACQRGRQASSRLLLHVRAPLPFALLAGGCSALVPRCARCAGACRTCLRMGSPVATPQPSPIRAPLLALPTHGCQVSSRTAFYCCAGAGALGFVLTLIFLPDTTGLDLHEIDRMNRYLLAGQARRAGLNLLFWPSLSETCPAHPAWPARRHALPAAQ